MQKKPALVSDIRPLSDIVVHQKTGLIISPKDEKKWAESLEKIISDPVNASSMGEAGRRVVEEKYNLKKMQKSLEQMYHEITE